MWVVSLAFSEAIPLESCFECFRSEYNFLVLTLVGASHKSTDFLVYPGESILSTRTSNGDVFVYPSLKSASKLISQFLDICGSRV